VVSLNYSTQINAQQLAKVVVQFDTEGV